MEIMPIITTLSVLAALAAIYSASRVHKRERERSAARVAALSAAAAEPAIDAWDADTIDERRPVERQAERAVPAGHAAHAEMFGTVERDAPSSGRLPMLAAAVLIAMLGGALVFLNSSKPSQAAAAAAPTPTPLELVALNHAREPRSLTITGTVRNPSDGRRLDALTAVVSLLDSTGALVSTKDVPLDYRALRPGEEAPFRLNIPNPGAVARYRVSFRAGHDVVPHVDRRSEPKLASAAR
jgi:hypothetical protein